MFVSFTTVAPKEIKGTFFIDSVKIKSEAEFLTSDAATQRCS